MHPHFPMPDASRNRADRNPAQGRLPRILPGFYFIRFIIDEMVWAFADDFCSILVYARLMFHATVRQSNLQHCKAYHSYGHFFLLICSSKSSLKYFNRALQWFHSTGSQVHKMYFPDPAIAYAFQ